MSQICALLLYKIAPTLSSIELDYVWEDVPVLCISTYHTHWKAVIPYSGKLNLANSWESAGECVCLPVGFTCPSRCRLITGVLINPVSGTGESKGGWTWNWLHRPPGCSQVKENFKTNNGKMLTFWFSRKWLRKRKDENKERRCYEIPQGNLKFQNAKNKKKKETQFKNLYLNQ